mmetsp:Transcript_50057/g.150624  ORF Transcript_50057/g.150624 Transcript_50057/m.150624 type:complete len:268 (-) Transcript_50057:363-1166(-)
MTVWTSPGRSGGFGGAASAAPSSALLQSLSSSNSPFLSSSAVEPSPRSFSPSFMSALIAVPWDSVPAAADRLSLSLLGLSSVEAPLSSPSASASSSSSSSSSRLLLRSIASDSPLLLDANEALAVRIRSSSPPRAVILGEVAVAPAVVAPDPAVLPSDWSNLCCFGVNGQNCADSSLLTGATHPNIPSHVSRALNSGLCTTNCTPISRTKLSLRSLLPTLSICLLPTGLTHESNCAGTSNSSTEAAKSPLDGTNPFPKRRTERLRDA